MTQARVELLADSRQVRRATDDLKSLEARGGKTVAATSRIDKAFNRLGNTIRNQVVSAFGALAATLAVRELVRMQDAYTGIQNRLRIVTDSTAQLTEVQGKLLQVANDSRAEFETTVGLYSTLARSTEDLGLSQDRLLRVTETINKAFAASGADAATAAGAIRQLGQGLASGALRGDEFNSVAEGAPEIMRAIAAETGMTIGALRKFAAEGKITSELLIRSLENYGDTVDEIFANSERTISQSFQEARNNAIQFIGGIEAVDDASQLFGDSIVTLSENLDTVVDVATVVATVFAARMGGALTSNIAAFTAAQIQAARYQATLASMAGVSRGTAVALTGVSLAARGAGAAMAVLGGPAGVVLAAAAAFIYFAEQQETLEERTDEAVTSIRELAQGFDQLTQAQARNQELELLNQMGELIDESNRLESELERVNKSLADPFSQLSSTGYAALKEQAQELTDELKLNETQQAALESAIAKLADQQLQAAQATREQAKATQEQADSKALDKIIQGLDDQIYGLENGEIAYEVMRAAREANIALDSPEADGIRERISERERLTQAIKDEAQAERERQQLREGVTGIVNDLSVGDDPAAQAEDRYFERLSIIDNSIAAEGQILDEHRAAMILAEQAYQDELTRIDAESEKQRTQLAMQEAQARRAATESMLAGLSGVFGNFAEIAKQGGEETFGTYKALASAQAAISAAVAINRALADGGPFLGPALAISIAALTGAQIAAINKQQYSPRALGGQVTSGGQYLVGERGPELITMGSNGNVTPYNQLMREARGGQAPQQNVRVVVENYGSEKATTSESVVNDERIIRVVVGNINARREVHNAITRTTTANNKVGA